MDGRMYDDLIEEVLEDFSIHNISNFLEEVGLLTYTKSCKKELFSDLIFLHGDRDEIYSKVERDFIEKLGEIIVYPDFYKMMPFGNMSCRFLAVDISNIPDEIYSSVFMMKIVNKALDGFNIYIIKADTGLHIGLKLFDRSGNMDCTMSETGKLPLLLEELCCDGSEDFSDYYNLLVDVFKTREQAVTNYDDIMMKKRGVQLDYLDMLTEIEKNYSISTRGEMDRYLFSFEEVYEESFGEKLKYCVEELKDVKSSKVNTIEMLFEAEGLAVQIEENIEDSLQEHLGEQMDTSSDELCVDDPEAMINLLKKKKGFM